MKQNDMFTTTAVVVVVLLLLLHLVNVVTFNVKVELICSPICRSLLYSKKKTRLIASLKNTLGVVLSEWSLFIEKQKQHYITTRIRRGQ